MGVFLRDGRKLDIIEASIGERDSLHFDDGLGKRFKAEAAKELAFKVSTGETFQIDCYRLRGKWYPNMIEHLSIEHSCPFCYDTAPLHAHCDELDVLRNEFFKAALAHPNVRLKAAIKIKPLGIS